MRVSAVIGLNLLLLSAILAAGCAGNTGASGGGEAGQALLEIKGSPGTEFSGSCTVGDGEPQEIGGQVPQSFAYTLGGKPLKCEISSEGEIEAKLTHGGTRSVQRMSGGTLNLTYKNGSISSSTSSRVTSSSGGAAGTGGTTNGAGDVTSESRDVSGFDEVELEGIGNLSIRQTGKESLSVRAEKDVLPKIRTEVVNNRLVIGPEPNANIRTTEPISYALTVKDLHALKLSGSGNVDAESIGTDRLGIDVSGSGAVTASGRADSQEVTLSGSGAYRAEDLESKKAKIDVGGSGSAFVNASDELDARVSGAGSVEYAGDPRVEKNVSGAGRVSKR